MNYFFITGNFCIITMDDLRLGHLSYKVKKDLKSWCFRIIL